MNKPSLAFVIAIVFLLVAIGVAGRLLPHAWNATPVGAAALFAGFLLGWRYAVVVPLATMFFSDLIIGFYNWPIMLSVYLGFVLVGLLGLAARRHQKFESFLAGGVAGATLFFLLTNGAVWWFSGMYPSTLGGLFMSYSAGLPFYKNMLIGDLFYVSVFYGVYQVAVYWLGYRQIAGSTLVCKLCEKSAG